MRSSRARRLDERVPRDAADVVRCERSARGDTARLGEGADVVVGHDRRVLVHARHPYRGLKGLKPCEADRRHGQRDGRRRLRELTGAERKSPVVGADGLGHHVRRVGDDLVEFRRLLGGHLVHRRHADEAPIRGIQHDPERFGLAVADDDPETVGQRGESEELAVVLVARYHRRVSRRNGGGHIRGTVHDVNVACR